MTGNLLWTSPDFEGVPAGSPVISDDGEYIFLTHNTNNGTVGTFSILSASSDGELFYTERNETAPFSPPGIYHNPAEGFYDGGEGNTNDIVVWSFAITDSSNSVSGAKFAFQFPIGFDGTTTGVGYTLLDEALTAYRSNTAPVITNSGYSMYLGATNSQFFAWLGAAGSDANMFDGVASAAVQFSLNEDVSRLAVLASPVLSSDPVQPMLFGPTAHKEFVAMDYDFSNTVVVDTVTLVSAEGRVDPFDRVVYYAETNGMVHQADADTLQDLWTFQTSHPAVEGEMALSADGSVLYVSDVLGEVFAISVTNTSLPPDSTPSPDTAEPSAMPVVGTPTSSEPSSFPIASPISAPPSSAPAAGTLAPESEMPSSTPDSTSSAPSTSGGDSEMPSSSPGSSIPATSSPTEQCASASGCEFEP